MSRNWKLIVYVIVLGLAALAILIGSGLWEITTRPAEFRASLPLVGLLTVFGWLCSSYRVQNSDSSYIVMGTMAQVASILLLPLPLALLTVGAAKLITELLARREWKWSWRAPIVNVSGAILANATGGACFYLLRGEQYLWLPGYKTVLSLPALVALAGSYHVVDVLVVVGAITMTSQDPPWTVFRKLFMDMLMPMISLTFIGITVAVLWHYSPVLSIFLTIPGVLSIRMFGAVAKLRQETKQAVLKMAESIDYRDTGTYEHSKRLADFSERLALSVGLIPEHVSEIVLASRVHDLGKIGISNEILLKQGPLTDEERHAMEDHPAIGANILSSYSAFQNSVEIVRHHHERWDGKGYPDGLKGEGIPIGSRIISVVDAFDAMTADRPYRKGMSVDMAVERLKDSIGSQFDPRICAAFIQNLIEDGAYVPRQSQPDLHIVHRDAASVS